MRVATRLMPCYGCQLKLFSRIHQRTRPIPLSITNRVACHGKILKQPLIIGLLWLGLSQNASPQLSSTPAAAQAATPAAAPVPPPQGEATVERPDFNVKIPRVNPPMRGEYDFDSVTEETEGHVYHLH